MKTNREQNSEENLYSDSVNSDQDIVKIHVLEMSFEEGRRVVERVEEGKQITRSCFFCRRSEDFISAHVQTSPEGIRVQGVKQPLFTVPRMLGHFIFHYKLCFDCSILLTGKVVDEDYEE